MRAARTAALRELSTPTQATGTPGGICAIESRASSPPAIDFEIEEALMACIGDEDDRFAADLATFGAAYGELARDDHRRFVDAFRNGAIPGVGER